MLVGNSFINTDVHGGQMAKNASSSEQASTAASTESNRATLLRRAWKVFCLEELFRTVPSGKLGEVNTFCDAWFTLMEQKFTEPHRKYHNFKHIEQLLILTRQFREHISHLELVTLSIWFHDLVYDSNSKNAGQNEDASALEFLSFASGSEKFFDQTAPLPNWIVNKEEVAVWIRETARHTSTSFESQFEKDFHLFLDFDLSILGSSRREYDDYASSIRAEYAHVPEEVYCKTRANFLKGLLMHAENIFKTEVMKKEFGKSAIDNLTREIARLESRKASL